MFANSIKKLSFFLFNNRIFYISKTNHRNTYFYKRKEQQVPPNEEVPTKRNEYQYQVCWHIEIVLSLAVLNGVYLEISWGHRLLPRTASSSLLDNLFYRGGCVGTLLVFFFCSFSFFWCFRRRFGDACLRSQLLLLTRPEDVLASSLAYHRENAVSQGRIKKKVTF